MSCTSRTLVARSSGVPPGPAGGRAQDRPDGHARRASVLDPGGPPAGRGRAPGVRPRRAAHPRPTHHRRTPRARELVVTLKAAIVGTGAVAHLHAQAVIADPRVELVAACDCSAERREAFADRYDVVSRYATITELLAGEQLDVVILCTPPDLHCEQTLAAFAAGVHVICEKPPALSLAELDKMQAAADAAGLALAIVFQQRTGSAAAHVKHLLDSGSLGRPLLAQSQTLWLRLDDYCAADWRGTWDGEGGGTTLGHGIHQMDLLAHLLGDWAEVDARTADHPRDPRRGRPLPPRPT